jgi:hypothetical protein
MAGRYDPTTGMDSTSERVLKLLLDEKNGTDEFRRLEVGMIPISRDDRNPRFKLKSDTSEYLGQIDDATAGMESDAILRQIIHAHLGAATEPAEVRNGHI